MSLRHFIFYLTFAVLLWGILRPEAPPQISENFQYSDKIIHLFAFYFFGLTTFIAFHNKQLIWVTLFLVLMAIGLEYLQDIIQPARQFSAFDALANFIGVILSLITINALSITLQNK